MKIIGITGTIGAGKGAAVEYLKQHGFVHYSARAYIEKEVLLRKLPVNRGTLVEVANDLREKFGSDYVISSLYKEALEAREEKIVIESIRTTDEVATLRTNSNFFLIGIDANVNIRYERIKNRKSLTDNISFEKFIADEKREMYSKTSSEQNIAAVMKMADVVIVNDLSFEALNKKLEKILRV